MKKIIDGKRYDTSLARFVGQFEVEPGRFEILYRKRTGEYFLHWEIGDDGFLSPLTYAEARRWAESHMDADAFEAEFGAIRDSDRRSVITVSLNSSGIKRAKRAAAIRGISLSALIDELFASL